MTTTLRNNKLVPFVKWAGGKRQLLGAINERMPKSYENYYEPFVGGGAVLFELQPNCAVINDINTALINVYQVVRDNPQGLMEAVDELDNNHLASSNPKEYYYEIRKELNNCLETNALGVDSAACFIYINKHCFNGLYRVNAKGLFNVPFNNSMQRSYSRDNLLNVSQYLENVKILSGDFEEACKDASKGDFVFLTVLMHLLIQPLLSRIQKRASLKKNTNDLRFYTENWMLVVVIVC